MKVLKYGLVAMCLATMSTGLDQLFHGQSLIRHWRERAQTLGQTVERA